MPIMRTLCIAPSQFQVHDQFTDRMWPSCELWCARKFHCANRVFRKLFDPTSLHKGRQRRTRTRNRL